jgi:hypothetical protein
VLPETLTIAPAAVVTGIAISSFGRYREPLWGGWFLTTLGMGLLCMLDESTPIAGWIFINVVPGLGLGMVIPAQSIAIQAATGTEHAGHAISMSFLVRTAGQAFGVAIGAAVFQNGLARALGNTGLSASALTVQAVTQEINYFTGSDEERRQLSWAIHLSLLSLWATGCALAGLAGLASLWMKAISLNQALQTEHGLSERESQTGVSRTGSGENKV